MGFCAVRPVKKQAWNTNAISPDSKQRKPSKSSTLDGDLMAGASPKTQRLTCSVIASSKRVSMLAEQLILRKTFDNNLRNAN